MLMIEGNFVVSTEVEEERDWIHVGRSGHEYAQQSCERETKGVTEFETIAVIARSLF